MCWGAMNLRSSRGDRYSRGSPKAEAGTAGAERANLGAALLHAGQLEEASVQLRAGWERLRITIGDALLVSDHVACWLAARGRWRDAVRILGYTDACYGDMGRLRQMSENRSRERSVALIKDELADEEIAALMRDGATLRERDAFELAFGGA